VLELADADISRSSLTGSNPTDRPHLTIRQIFFSRP
jgi:hypothetical protein